MVTLTVQLRLDHPEAGIDLEQLEVRLQNKEAEFRYSERPDASGRVTFAVAPGKYDVMASGWFPVTRIAVNGASEEFLLTTDGMVDAQGASHAPQLELLLHVAIPNPLIIREAYYHGSATLEGANYT